jgi:hypothetical protein
MIFSSILVFFHFFGDRLAFNVPLAKFNVVYFKLEYEAFNNSTSKRKNS